MYITLWFSAQDLTTLIMFFLKKKKPCHNLDESIKTMKKQNKFAYQHLKLPKVSNAY